MDMQAAEELRRRTEQDEINAARYAAIKRGDLVGVVGKPGRTKRGELSIFPTSMQILTPCLHMIPKTISGFSNNASRASRTCLIVAFRMTVSQSVSVSV